ncbi:MAG: hypothetical protein ACI8TQ_002095 [Planctomycetota bacterium]|jgi:hypothetical protein
MNQSKPRSDPSLLPPGKVGRGSPAARKLEPQAVILAGDVLRWAIPNIGAFPRNMRYGVGTRIEGALMDV